MSKINYNSIDINENEISNNNSSEGEFENYVEEFEENNIDGIEEYENTENEEISDEEQKNEDSEEDDDEDDEDQIEEDEDNQEDNSSDSQDAGRKKDIPLIIDFKSKEHKIISCIDRITRPVLTKYEKTLILGQRAQQILKGSNILVNIEKLKNRNPLEIARLELSKGVIPFIIRRPLPNGQYEDWKVNELKDINS
jgi:DNA-directed RNA polymerase I, II, and III subunit RPABC2